MPTPHSDHDRIGKFTRASDVPRLFAVPEGIEAKPKPPYEQTEEFQRDMRLRRQSRLHKAGLYGAYAVADSDEGRMVYGLARKGRGAYLWGDTGRGKTYAAATAVRLFVESGDKGKLITAKRLLDDVRAGFDGKDKDALSRAERYDLLALDDLGAERPTDWAIETLTRLLDTRSLRGLPTIVTSNYRIGQIRDIWGGVDGKRIASRLGGSCEIIEFKGADRRLS